MALLTSKLLTPGTKFIVTEDIKDTTFGPGSIGMMSYIMKKDNNFENVAHACVVIIRRGKGGMNRISCNHLNFPIFFDKRMIEHGDYLPIEKPVAKKYHVNIETMDYTALDLLKVRSLDFLGWAVAYSLYLKNIINKMSKTPKGSWPSDPSHIMNIASTIPELYDHDKKSTEKKYTDPDWRMNFTKEARRMESSLIRCVLKYKEFTSDIAKNAIAFIKFTNDSFYKVADDKDVKETIKFCDDKGKFIACMIKEKGKNIGKPEDFGG